MFNNWNKVELKLAHELIDLQRKRIEDLEKLVKIQDETAEKRDQIINILTEHVNSLESDIFNLDEEGKGE